MTIFMICHLLGMSSTCTNPALYGYFNLPKFFETKIVYNTGQQLIDFSLFKNGNIENIESLVKFVEKSQNTISYEMTSLRNNPHYIRFYVNWCRLLITCVAPLTALIIFNYKIFYGIRYTHMRAGKSGRREANLALVLCCIVVIFFLGHIPRVVLTVHEWLLTEDMIRCSHLLIRPAWNLGLTSLNQLLYCRHQLLAELHGPLQICSCLAL